jgi:hypothetical protein
MEKYAAWMGVARAAHARTAFVAMKRAIPSAEAAIKLASRELAPMYPSSRKIHMNLMALRLPARIWADLRATAKAPAS